MDDYGLVLMAPPKLAIDKER